jgi:SNF2 family DNA or RNA helicase
MVEAQAVDRVHRIGQEREVWITRYIVRDSIETVSADTALGHEEGVTLVGSEC